RNAVIIRVASGGFNIYNGIHRLLIYHFVHGKRNWKANTIFVLLLLHSTSTKSLCSHRMQPLYDNLKTWSIS
ncbi:MAG: hypothetical protein ACKOC0_06235, partial [Cytophagales bacterium]